MTPITLKSNTIKEKFFEYSHCVIKGGYQVAPSSQKSVQKIIDTFQIGEYGIVVSGGVGSGKTILFEMMQKIIPSKDPMFFRKKNVLDVVLDFSEHGHEALRADNQFNMLYDDLGTEDIGYRYGEKINVFEKMIQLRYDVWRSKGIKTYFTTNLTNEQLEQKYGFRCWSRLCEMCQSVVINESDKRKLRNFIGLPPVNHPIQKSKEDLEWEEMYKKRKEKPQENITPFKSAGQKLKEKFGVSKEIMDEYNKKIEAAKDSSPNLPETPEG